MEALPADDPLTDFWPSGADPLYASKHNLFPLFTDIRDNPARVANIKPGIIAGAGTPKGDAGPAQRTAPQHKQSGK